MQVEFGMSTTGVDDIVGRARRLEELGYDYVGVGEHIAFHLSTSNPFVALAAAAAVTERIRLLTSIVLTPIYPPPLLAKIAASLDVVSQGRLTLGVGVGGEYPPEIEACGVPMSERGARASESLEIVRRLWTEQDVSFEGRFTTLSGITLDLRPVQHPHPPIWVSGRTEAAMRRASRLGDGWMPYMYSPEMLAESVAKIATWAAEAGRGPEAVRPSIFAFISCHADPQVAFDRAVAKLGSQYAQDFVKAAARYVITGTPENCLARIRAYVDAGATAVLLGQACADEHGEEHERLIATEVLPAFR